MFTFSLEQLPMLIALIAFVLTLVLKRNTIRTRDLFAFALLATLVFGLLTGAFNALHLPHLVYHLL